MTISATGGAGLDVLATAPVPTSGHGAASVLLADLGGALTGIGTLVVGGGFVVVGIIVLAVLGNRRSAGAQKRRLAALSPLPELITGIDAVPPHADEAVRAADQERMFADAEFGGATAQTFGGAVTRARDELDAAYRARRHIDEPLAAGQEVTARREVETIRTRVGGAVEEPHRETARVGAPRDDSRHAAERARRATARHEELSARLSSARTVEQEVVAEHGAGATRSLGEGTEGAARLLAGARSDLDDLGAASGMLTGEQLERLSAAEHALQDAGAALDAVVAPPRALESSRRELDDALGELDTALARAHATRDEDPRLPQAIAVAEQVRTRAATASTQGADPVSALAAVRAADAELDAVIAASRDRYDADREARRLGGKRGSVPSDSYDPRVGDRARQAADDRYGPLDALGMLGGLGGSLGGFGAYGEDRDRGASRPSGIAGPSSSSARGSGSGMLEAVISEIAAGAVQGAMRGGRGRSRRRF